MNLKFKNEATAQCCETWVTYPFENSHPLKDERFYAFMHCLCLYEDYVDEEDFLSLSQYPNCARTKEELEKAYDKYDVIYHFYQYLNLKEE